MGKQDFQRWQIEAPPRPPSEHLREDLRRLESFDIEFTEVGRIMLIDTLFVEVVPNHAGLKVWKAWALESDTLIGIADCLIAPKMAYLTTPVLCAVEAKRDDFIQGRAQCAGEMLACREKNR